MVKTEKNPGGPPIDVFHSFRPSGVRPAENRAVAALSDIRLGQAFGERHADRAHRDRERTGGRGQDAAVAEHDAFDVLIGGRTQEKIEQVVRAIVASGGSAEAV